MHPAPTPHEYDWGSESDLAVQDVLSDQFEQLWVGTGRSNRAAFEKVFRPVPNDTIKNWKQYGEYLKPNAGISVSLPGEDSTLRSANVRLDMSPIVL
jgi:phospholipase D1/2